MEYPSPIICFRVRQILILQLNAAKPENPMSNAMRLMLMREVHKADIDPDVAAIVLTGGPERSFCVGGDFKEVSRLDTSESVDAWIRGTREMYVALLSVSKPVVAAMGGYAIGIGLQLGLMCDERIADDKSQLSMWELKVGVACTMGACILQHCFGRLVATRMVYGCKLLGGEEAFALGMVDHLVRPESLLERAIEDAERLGSYPSVPFAATKRSINASLIDALNRNAGDSSRAHMESFAAKSSQAHMEGVLG